MPQIIHLRRLALLGALLLAAFPASGQRQAPPAPMPARPLSFPAFREARLPNGMGLVIVENHAHPVADLYLIVRGGGAVDAAGKAGTAELLAATLVKGTTTRTASQISELIESTGGRLNAFSGDDFVGVAATVLSDQLPMAFDLVSDVALRPAFPESELETVRQQTLSTLRVALGQPASLAGRRMSRELYGSHPYGTLETPESVQGITAADLKAFHAANFTAGNALLVVAGDVDGARVEALARQHFGAWTGAASAAMTEPALPTRARTGITLVHRPGSVQSVLRVGFPGIRPSDPDYYPLVVMNQILGVGSEGRLFRILREQKGWTYGAYSTVTRPRGQGVLTSSAEVRNEVTDSALVEVLSQLRRLQDEPVSAQDLEDAKGYLIGSFPLQIETPGQVASQIATTRLLGLPIEALLQHRERLAAVTAADVQRVARKYLTLGSAAIVVVGDATKVLAKLDPVAPVTLVDVEGRPVERASLEVRASTERYDLSRLTPVTLSYRVMAQGNPVGSQKVAIARDGNGWVRTDTVMFGPVRQVLVSRWSNEFAAVSHSESFSGPMTGEATATVANGRVGGQANLPPQAGGQRTFDAAAVPGMVFDGQEFAALAVADLAAGKTLAFPIFKVNTGDVGTHTFRVTGVESVTVPAGTFPAFKVEMSGGQAPMTVWLRQEGLHVPLKFELQGMPVTVELER